MAAAAVAAVAGAASSLAAAVEHRIGWMGEESVGFGIGGGPSWWWFDRGFNWRWRLAELKSGFEAVRLGNRAGYVQEKARYEYSAQHTTFRSRIDFLFQPGLNSACRSSHLGRRGQSFPSLRHILSSLPHRRSKPIRNRRIGPSGCHPCLHVPRRYQMLSELGTRRSVPSLGTDLTLRPWARPARLAVGRRGLWPSMGVLHGCKGWRWALRISAL